MTAEARSGARAAIAFGGHAGWLHLPPEGRAGAVGVVLCAPLGRDARCAHRPLRLLAERLTTAGVSVLRYDHLGTGDSLDLPEGADALPIWLDGVGAAVAHLKLLAGVERVVLVGLRFGATLAALAREHADGLALLAPIARGRGWLRELTLSTAVLAPSTGGASVASGLDADGLVLNPATMAAISAIDLKSLGHTARPTLVVAQNPTVEALGEGLGATVTSFEGFDLLFEDSHSNAAPEAVFAGVTDWVRKTFADALAHPIAPKAPDPKAARLFPPGAIERPVIFGDGLRGVLCGPADASRLRAGAVVLGNTGGDPRAGIGGFSTAAARALARAGHLSLRFDFSGLGDSPGADDGAGSHVYETPRGDEIEAARALLAEEGARRVVVGGICSGGYHALHAALDNPALAGVFAVNTVVLAWREGTSLAPSQRDQGRSTKAYLQRATDPATWLRLLRGGLDLRAVSKTLTRRLKGRLAARSADAPEAAVKTALAAMAARGGRTWWVVGSEDPALDALEAHFGSAGQRLAALPGAHVSIVEGLDHGLALSGSRDKAREQLLTFMAELDA